MRVVTATMDRDAGLEHDQMARMKMLEGALNLPTGTYSRDVRGFWDGATEIPRQHPDIDPDWFARKDFGFREALLAGANKILKVKGDVGRLTAEEIVQNMGAGFTPSLKVKEDVYRQAGKGHANEILSGRLGPRGALSILQRSAVNRALDEWRDRMRRKKERERSSPTILRTEEHGSLVDSANAMMARNPLGVMLELLSSPAGNKFKNWLYRTVETKGTPMMKAILDAFIEDPGGSQSNWGRNPKVVALSQTGAPITHVAVKKHWDKIVDLIRKEMRKEPGIYGWMEDYIELEALGYGGAVRASAKRVASRYLARRIS